MAVYRKFYSFAYYLSEVFTSGDPVTLALSNSVPNASNTNISDITEIDYTYCSSRSLSIAGVDSGSGIYSITIDNVTLTASGGNVGPFRYLVIYADSGGDLICYYDYGYSITLTSGQSIDLTFSTGKLFSVQ